MAAVVEAASFRVRQCVRCGEEFEDRSRTSPRSYCDSCAGKQQPTVAAMGVYQGEPNTVQHFEAWAYDLELDNGEPWVVEPFFLAYLEDFFAEEAGRPVYPESWLLVPEGNTKTTSMAGLGLYHLEFTAWANALWAASARDQALLGYEQAEGFVLRSTRLSSIFKCHPGYRRIAHKRNGSRLQIFAADDRTGDGVIPTLAFLDELHRHRSMRLYRTWRGKLAKRDGRLATLSTSGEPASEFEEAHDRILQASQVERDGSFTRAVAGGIVLHQWAVPLDGDVNDLSVVKAANPFSGVTLDLLAEKKKTPTMTEPHWRRFVCNQAQTIIGSPYVERAAWDACADPGMVIPRRAVTALGLDGSRTFDTTVVAWASPDDEGMVRVGAKVFSVRSDVPHHQLHDGKIDFADVEEFIIDRFSELDVREAAYDPRYLERSAEIIDARLSRGMIFPVEPQSKHMRDALMAFERLVVDGCLRHDGDPVVLSHILNCRVEREEANRDQIRRVAKIDSRRPIDSVIALALACWRATRESFNAEMGPLIEVWA